MASITSGFQFINIEERECKVIIDKYLDKGTSKVRKIYSSKESYSIIGLDHEHYLCLWPIQIKKKNLNFDY